MEKIIYETQRKKVESKTIESSWSFPDSLRSRDLSLIVINKSIFSLFPYEFLCFASK